MQKEGNLALGTHFREFSDAYIQEVNQRYSKDLLSHQLLTKKIPESLRDWLVGAHDGGDQLIIKGSIGAGVTTPYPWVGIFHPAVSRGAQEGYYVVLLISDDFQDLYLTLNQGSTKRAHDVAEQTRQKILALHPKVDGFTAGRIPKGGVVKKLEYKSTNNGRKYEETNIFYRKYSIESIDDSDLEKHLKRILEVYQDCVDHEEDGKGGQEDLPQPKVFSLEDFEKDVLASHLQFSGHLLKRLAALLVTKPFVLLTGLTGSGKTKLAQAAALWLSEAAAGAENESGQYCLVPVGSDWTNREPLLGYPNALEEGKYVKPENGVLDLLLRAQEDPRRPYFLILDEMNLSHVERFFADFLSVMESGGVIPLHGGQKGYKDQDGQDVPPKLGLPKNLFILGTVNVDETTYMFSPKVLDRAGVIEFRAGREDLQAFLENPGTADLSRLRGRGAACGGDFVQRARQETPALPEEERKPLEEGLLQFFEALQPLGAEFGFRTASEILTYAGKLRELEDSGAEAGQEVWSLDQIIDTAVMQKLLPKLHGSRRRIVPVLEELAGLCAEDGTEVNLDRLEELPEDAVRYPLSLEKLRRMYGRAVQEGFTSFAEA